MYRIEINMDKKCSRCGKGGAMQNGICMKCMAKAIKNGEVAHNRRRRGLPPSGDRGMRQSSFI